MTQAADLADAISQQAVTVGTSSPSVRGADWQTAIVTAVGAGTVDCGTVTARRLESYQNPALGDRIVITQSGNGNWLACGRTSSTVDTAWLSYTPTWIAATTSPSVGNGTLLGRYSRSGRTIVCHINLIAGSTTTFGSGTYSFTLPVQAADQGCTYVGHAHLFQSTSGGRYAGQFLVSPAQTASSPSFPTSSAVSTHSLWTQGTPLTLNSTAQVRITVVYEAAS